MPTPNLSKPTHLTPWVKEKQEWEEDLVIGYKVGECLRLSLSPDEYVKRDDFKSEVEKLAHLEEVSWHQK